MKHGLSVFVLSLLVFSISCQQKPVEYIIPTEIEPIFLEAAKGKGITTEESAILIESIFDSVQQNTIGKHIPKILVRDLQNKTLNLQDEIQEKAMIICGDVYCGFGMECLQNIIPEANKDFQKTGLTLPIICLMVKTSYDFEDSTRFKEVLKEFSSVYDRIYIMDEEEAAKMNAVSGSVRYYVSKDHRVTDAKFGHCTPENLQNEMIRFAKK